MDAIYTERDDKGLPKMKKTKQTKLTKFLFGIAVVFPAGYFFSLYYSELYMGGDQVAYNALYQTLVETELGDISFAQREYTGSSEPLYGIVAWVGSQLTSKNEWFSIFNAMLLASLLAMLEKRRVSRLLYPLIFTNYYLFVIAFSAERLKFAVMLAFLAYLAPARWKYPVASLSILFHFQGLLFGLGLFGRKAKEVFGILVHGRLKTKLLIQIFFIATFLTIIWLTFGKAITLKLSHYVGNNISLQYKFLVFCISGLLLARDKMEAFFTYLALGIATIMLGGDRLNMVTFMFTIYYSFAWNRGLNPVTFLLLSYFSWRGLVFLSDIASLGTGYPQDLMH